MSKTGTDTTKIPRGEVLHRTEEELDAMTSIAVLKGDITAAQAVWEANAPDEYTDLLDAKPVEDNP